mgnify:FL=1|tara:strand:- start:375 stop:554 length:180 start_codon:yes stop_codon:yes gene_type:complete
MADIKYRNDNEEILDKCCMVIKYYQNKAQDVREAKHSTRVAIQDKLEQKRLREEDELYG